MSLAERIRVCLQPASHEARAGVRGYIPFIVGLLILAVCMAASQPFWLTNDDVSMAMVSSGTGIAAWPSPRLALTNIAWGYLVHWLPDIGGIQPYTLLTYTALAAAYLAVLYALVRSEVNRILAACLLLIFYVPVLTYPQYTLVAGHLAVAGIALLCIPPDRQSVFGVYLTGVLIVFSGLVRADETILVAMVASPILIGYWRAGAGSLMRRHWLMALALSAVIFSGFQLWDLYTFSSGSWGEFAGTYTLRTEFTDFNMAGYYLRYKEVVRSAGYSANDLHLFANWFYLDPQVFSPEKLAQLSGGMPWYGRIVANLCLLPVLLLPFTHPLVIVLVIMMAFIAVFHERRGYFLGSLAVLAGIMIILLLMGRPGVTRIYVPACAALVLLGSMQPAKSARYAYGVVVAVGVLAAIGILLLVHTRNQRDQRAYHLTQSAGCSLSHEPLVVIWGSSYPYTLHYPPFGAADGLCPLKIYAIGEYSLTPYSLAQLHQATGGKDLVPSLLQGQSLDFIASPADMLSLQGYFRQHYSAELPVTSAGVFADFTLYKVGPAQVVPGIDSPMTSAVSGARIASSTPVPRLLPKRP